MQLAIKADQIESLRILLDRGTEIDTHGALGETALHTAVRMGKEDFVKVLLRYVAQVNRADCFKRTIFYLAAKGRDYSIMELLIQQEANINAQDCYKKTALKAIIKEDGLLVDKLINLGADTTHIDNYGGSAMTRAMFLKINRIIMELVAERSKREDDGADLLNIGKQSLDRTRLKRTVAQELAKLIKCQRLDSEDFALYRRHLKWTPAARPESFSSILELNLDRINVIGR